MPSPSIFATRPKNTTKIPRNASGWISAQAMPSTACVYLTRTSRSANARIVPRNAHSSRSAWRNLGLADASRTTSAAAEVRGKRLASMKSDMDRDRVYHRPSRDREILPEMRHLVRLHHRVGLGPEVVHQERRGHEKQEAALRPRPGAKTTESSLNPPT